MVVVVVPVVVVVIVVVVVLVVGVFLNSNNSSSDSNRNVLLSVLRHCVLGSGLLVSRFRLRSRACAFVEAACGVSFRGFGFCGRGVESKQTLNRS